jgi:hypothetical protein
VLREITEALLETVFHLGTRCDEQTLLFGSNNCAGKDASSVRGLQVSGKLYKLQSEIVIVGAHNGQRSPLGVGECLQKPIEALFPDKPAQEQHKWLPVRGLSHQPMTCALAIASAVTTSGPSVIVYQASS